MKRVPLAALAGLVLGLLDGLSAWFAPDARSELLTITLFASAKGVLTGLLVGVSATRFRSWQLVLVGALVGLVLSVVAAIPSGTYLQVVVPGTALGAIVGAILTKWGR